MGGTNRQNESSIGCLWELSPIFLGTVWDLLRNCLGAAKELTSGCLGALDLVHLIYAIRAHLDLGRASRPFQLPSCHLKMEIEISVFTSFLGHASPQPPASPCGPKCLQAKGV